MKAVAGHALAPFHLHFDEFQRSPLAAGDQQALSIAQSSGPVRRAAHRSIRAISKCETFARERSCKRPATAGTRAID